MALHGKLNDRDAKCPFFGSHNANTIVCEGLFPDSSDHIIFRRNDDKKIQYAVFCSCHYQKCERYQAIMKGYQDEE